MLVHLRFRSSQTHVPQWDANFGIGALATPVATTVLVGLLVWDGQFRARVVASALRDSRVRFPRYALSFTSVSGRSLPEAVSVCHLPFASSYWITSV